MLVIDCAGDRGTWCRASSGNDSMVTGVDERDDGGHKVESGRNEGVALGLRGRLK